ncbi:MAG: protoheme IX farnesyltransferase [Phycisphaerales bacterium]|nr:protoheme IX farnesyltransferase [Phycisphaerales bacterium]
MLSDSKPSDLAAITQELARVHSTPVRPSATANVILDSAGLPLTDSVAIAAQPTCVTLPAELIAPAQTGLFRALVETTKPRITRLVTITSIVGFVMAAIARTWTFESLATLAVAAIAGTALSAAGANALNQWMERRRDALMRRTAGRPLPRGNVAPAAVLATGIGLGIAGVSLLLAFCGPVPALVSLACILVYVLAYTPLKPISPIATFVGAIPGALPPLIGWSAASAAPGFAPLLEPAGLSLFAIMFIWQIPHFLAIAWMYQDDYAKGGFRVLPLLPNGGPRTARTVALWTLLLVPATLAPAWFMPDRLGWAYLTIAGVSGVAFAWLAARLVIHRTRPAARRVFFASIIHLPLLLVAMVGEALIRAVI